MGRWERYDATSIDDAGAMQVNGVNYVSSEYQAFLLYPVPEPGTWAPWLAGFAGVGASARQVPWLSTPEYRGTLLHLRLRVCPRQRQLLPLLLPPLNSATVATKHAPAASSSP